ncbi:MAG: hypothetical protein ACHQ9S_18995 [Candidatus Binatia bacterium]
MRVVKKRPVELGTTAMKDGVCSPGDEYIETASGKKFFLMRPTFDIGDIAHALANNCRYTGHTKNRYSVAEHSVLVSMIMQDQKLGNPYEGLMHDAHEAYICDMASPWKRLLPDYREHEARIELAMRRWAVLPDKISSEAKLVDYAALILEARVLIPSKAKDWPMAPKVIALANKVQQDYMIMCWDAPAAKHAFLVRYSELTK